VNKVDAYEYSIFYNPLCMNKYSQEIDIIGIVTYLSDLFFDIQLVPFLVVYNFNFLAVYYTILVILKIV
jgi:hypothetical protein